MATADDRILTEWFIKTGEAVKSVKELAGAIRAEQGAERNRQLVLTELEKQTKKNTEETTKMATATDKMAKSVTVGSQAMATSLGNLLAGAVSRLTSGMGELIQKTGEYTTASAIYTGNINEARKATMGLATDTDIMVAKNRLATLGVKMTDAEFNAMLGQLTKISGAMNVDLKFALESATTMLARQSTAVADNVGVVIKAEEAQAKYAKSIGKTTSQLTDSEKKIAFQREALAQLANKAKELGDRQNTITDNITKFKNTVENTLVAVTAYINKSQLLADALGAVNKALQDIGRGISVDQSRKAAGQGDVEAMEEGLKEQAKKVQAVEFLYNRSKSAYYAEQVTKQRQILAGMEEGLEIRRMEVAQSIDQVRLIKEADAATKQLVSSMKSAGPVAGITGGKGKATPMFGKTPAESFPGAAPEMPPAAVSIGEVTSYGAESVTKTDKELEKTTKAITAADEAAKKYKETWKLIGDDFASLFAGALTDFAGGLWEVADAIDSTGKNADVAFAKMLKAVLKSISKQATIKAIFEAAEALGSLARQDYAAAGQHAAAAALYAAVAGVAGAAGNAINTGSESKTTTAAPAKSQEKSFGQAVKNDRPIYVNVYIGDPNSRSAALIGKQNIMNTVSQAAA